MRVVTTTSRRIVRRRWRNRHGGDKDVAAKNYYALVVDVEIPRKSRVESGESTSARRRAGHARFESMVKPRERLCGAQAACSDARTSGTSHDLTLLT